MDPSSPCQNRTVIQQTNHSVRPETVRTPRPLGPKTGKAPEALQPTSGTSLPVERVTVRFSAPSPSKPAAPATERTTAPLPSAPVPTTLTVLNPPPAAVNENSTFPLLSLRSNAPVRESEPFEMPLLTEDPRKALQQNQTEVQAWAKEQGRLRSELAEADDLEGLRQVQARWSGRAVPAPQRAALMNRLRRHDGLKESVEFYRESVSLDPEFGKLESPFLGYVESLNKLGRPTEALSETEHFLSRPDEEDHRCEATTAKLLTNAGEAYKQIGLRAEAVMQKSLKESSLVGFAEALGGSREKWRGGEEQAMHDLSRVVWGHLDGHSSADQVTQTLAQLTGASFESPLARASVEAGLESYKKLIESTGLDRESQLALESGLGGSVGRNLARIRRASQSMAGRRFSEAFHMNFDPRAGSEYVQHLQETGHPKRAAQVARAVKASSERNPDARGRQALLEVALVTDDHNAATAALPEALGLMKSNAERDGLSQNLARLSRTRRWQGGETRMIDYARSRVAEDPGDRSVVEHWESSQAEGLDLARRLGSEAQVYNWKRGLLQSKTFHFKDINSKFVGGNISFGGAVPDITVNQQDLKLARRLLGGLGLDKVENFQSWDEQVDTFLQKQYRMERPDGERPLEDLQSREHGVLDSFRMDLKELTGSEQSGSSQTNLMVELLMGRGDCRHVAYSKQLLYDVWKGDLQNRLMSESVRAAEADNFDLSNTKLRQARRLDRQQLVTAAVGIDAPIATEGGEKYRFLRDEQGRPLPGEMKEVESHTFNLLLEYDENGGLPEDGVTAKDSFYQKTYPLGDAGLHLSADGWRTDSGMMGIRNSEGEEIPFRMRFARYSGNGPRENEEECGLTLLGGVPVKVGGHGGLTLMG